MGSLSKDDKWSTDDINALEYAFYKMIPAEKNLNSKTPTHGGANFVEYTDKINQIKSLITAIGFTMFSDEEATENIQVMPEENQFTAVEDLQNGLARIPEFITPKKVVKSMVDLLPDEVWNSHTTFLDPACKGGEYLREVYDRLMDCESLQAEFPNEIERSNHILKDQIFGIALSEVSMERTTIKLHGFGYNIRVIPSYMKVIKAKFNDNVSEQDKREYIMDKINKEFGKEMHFDVVIGNPPYQEATANIYQYFINLGMILSDKVCMITKSNWMTSDTLSSTRKDMIKFGIKRIISYPVINELFSGVSTQVSIFYLQKGCTEDTFFSEIKHGNIVNEYSAKLNANDIIFNTKIEYSIANKINTSNGNFGERTYPQESFGIASNGTVGRGDTACELKDKKTKDDIYNIAVVYMDKSIPYVMYTSYDYIPRRQELANKYKVICGARINNNQNVITNINILNPKTVCTSSWCVLYATDNKDEIHNVSKYIKTKFFRYLVKILCNTDKTNMSSYNFSKVPLLDFTSNSDIDWTQSISDIDQQLYKKYNLSDYEKAYIESTIAPVS